MTSCTTHHYACDCHEKEFAQIRAERDEARLQILALFARQHLTCGWCNEMMQAPPGFTPPMTTEMMTQTERRHLAVCPKHPIREVEKERDAAVAALSAIEERDIRNILTHLAAQDSDSSNDING
jgi:hypothetical protein